MHDRPLACWGLVAALSVAVGACQLPARERRTSQPAPPARLAEDAAVALTTAATSGDADGTDDGAAGERPGEVAPAPPAALAVRDAGRTTAEAGDVSHCGEPPERIAARENIRRMTDEHARMAARLQVLRAEAEGQALEIVNDLRLERIPAIAADLASRSAVVPGEPLFSVGVIGNLLHEIAFWAALCRALRDGLGECDRLDSDAQRDGACCRSVVRIVRLAHDRPSELSLLTLVGSMFGWRGEQQRDERTWQVVRQGRGEATCERLAGREPPERWSGPLCRALAAADVSRCAALEDEMRRRTCAAVVHAVLGPGAAAGDRPSAAGALLREYVAPSGSGPTCATGIPRFVTEVFDATGVFNPGPLVVPEIERERGLVPAP